MMLMACSSLLRHSRVDADIVLDGLMPEVLQDHELDADVGVERLNVAVGVVLLVAELDRVDYLIQDRLKVDTN